MQTNTPLTDHDVRQLEAWLQSPKFKGRSMQIDRLQGFLAAVVSSPDIIPPSTWVPEVVGGEVDYDSMEQAQEFMGRLMRFYNSVAATLFDQQPLTLIATSLPAEQQKTDYQSWCEGYITGWSLSQEEWLRPGNGALKKLTFPILFLSGAFREASEREGRPCLPEDEYRAVEQNCIDMLAQAVTDIYHFWLEQRRPASVPRQTAKVGRNEACPCGSGKKFKLCCGSNRTVH